MDCNDNQASIYPGATEIPNNGIDENCDGKIDNFIWYRDVDGDGYGTSAYSWESVTQPPGYVANYADCNDADAAVYPGAPDILNNFINENCEKYAINPGDYFNVQWPNYALDSDGDGFGDIDTAAYFQYNPPSQYVFLYPPYRFDCNDTDNTIHPSADSTDPSGIDTNCDGLIHIPFFIDADNDGYGDDGFYGGWATLARNINDDVWIPPGYSRKKGDCNDNDPAIIPNTIWYVDTDGDGFGDPAVFITECQPSISGYVANNTDCNDALASVYPGATEIPGNGIDEDCDGSDVGALPWYADADGDGFGNPSVSQQAATQPTGYVANNTDHNDTDNKMYPGAPEIPNNGIDEDGDGTDALLWYADADGDGFGNPAVSQQANTAPAGYVANNTDCNDSAAAVYPGAAEIAGNGIDENCDGTDALLWYADADGDSFGNPVVSQQANIAPAGYVANNTDCNDADATVYPGATEIPGNSIDENCDGTDALLWYADADGDGFGNPAVSQQANIAPEGYVANNTDCNDADATVYPGATEIPGNSIDENCDGTDALLWYADADGDSFGNPAVSQQANTSPAGYVANNTDCNDADATVYPGATEIPNNGIDENCDGTDALLWYADADGDSFGNPVVSQQANTAPAGYVANNTDCNDADATVYPGATEIPNNGIDENCDGTDALLWYADADGDSFGNPAVSQQANTAPSGYVANNTDCNDALASVYPGATEIPGNGIDENCDGTDALLWYADADGDSFGNPAVSQQANTAPAGYVANNTDCNDALASVYPGATEIPGNGIDENCDGTDALLWYADADGDSFGNPAVSQQANTAPAGYVANNTDCNDALASVYPGATEIPGNGIDENCDGTDALLWYADADGDSFGNPAVSQQSNTAPAGYVANNTDCNDALASVYPGATEIPNNGIDENCDGTDALLWYADADGDSFGNPAVSQQANTAPAGYVANNTDCNDALASVYPGATEIPGNGIDENCDGTDALLWYADADGDTFGNPALSQQANTAPAGYVANNTDCNDALASVYPGATEIPGNGIDENCDGTDALLWYADADGDTFGNPALSQQANTAPAGYVANNTDCNDALASVYPGATEIPGNGIDENCDGTDALLWYADADGDSFGNPAVSQQANTAPAGYVANNTDCNDSLASVYPGATEIPNNGIDENCDGADLINNLTDLIAECTVDRPQAPTILDAAGNVIVGIPNVSFPITQQGQTIIIWTFTATNGTVTQISQKVIIKDVTAPVPNISNLPNITIDQSSIPKSPEATDNCSGKIVGVSNATFPITKLGRQTITWSFNDGNGNISKQNQIVTVIIKPQEVIGNIRSALLEIQESGNASIILYPNPTYGNFNIYVVNNAVYDIEVFNGIGILVHKQKTTGSLTKINSESWAVGTYTVRLIGKQKTITKRIIKK